MALEEGELLGKYKIIAPISKGGTGEVYRALDTTLDREVALKILLEKFEESNELLKRFKQEAQLIAKLHHPNVVSVYDFFEHEGRAVVIMELVEGSTLGALVKLPYALPESIVLMLGLEILKGLREAHKLGIIHRDIKPANILVSKTRGVKLSDFGLAKLEQVDSELTREGMYVGTPSYSSPEQLQGMPVDQRSDIFSLGLTLFILAKKAHAFKKRGDSHDTVAHKIIEGDLNTMAAEAYGTMSPELEGFLKKAIEPDASKRFRNCDEMIGAIEKLLHAWDQLPYAQKLEDFLRDPEAGCLENFNSRTEAYRFSPPARLKLKGLLQLVSGVALLVFAYWLWTSGSPPTWRPSIQVDPEARILQTKTGKLAKQYQVLPAVADQWIIEFERTDSVLDRQVIPHKRVDYGEYHVFEMPWGDKGFASLRSTHPLREGYHFVRPFNYTRVSEILEFQNSETVDLEKTGFLQRYLGWRFPLPSSFSRTELIANTDSDLADLASQFSKLCQKEIPLQVAWKEVSDEVLYNVDPVKQCGRPIEFLQHTCDIEKYRELIRARVDRIICSYSEQNRIEIKNKSLIWEIDPRHPMPLTKAALVIEDQETD